MSCANIKLSPSKEAYQSSVQVFKSTMEVCVGYQSSVQVFKSTMEVVVGESSLQLYEASIQVEWYQLDRPTKCKREEANSPKSWPFLPSNPMTEYPTSSCMMLILPSGTSVQVKSIPSNGSSIRMFFVEVYQEFVRHILAYEEASTHSLPFPSQEFSTIQAIHASSLGTLLEHLSVKLPGSKPP